MRRHQTVSACRVRRSTVRRSAVHPGDAFTDPGVPVELLLLQLIGFDTKTSLSADYCACQRDGGR